MIHHLPSSICASLCLPLSTLNLFTYSSSPMAPSLLLLLLTVTAFLPHPSMQVDFHVELNHINRYHKLSKFDFIQRSIARGKQRLEKLDATTVQSPIRFGSGDYLMKLSIGTPPSPFTGIMDTGSALVWLQCQPCISCFPQPDPLFDPKRSNSFLNISCSSDFCNNYLTNSVCVDANACGYTYGYADKSYTQGYMATDTFTFGEVSVPHIGFGCGFNNKNTNSSPSSGEEDLGSGLVGLDRGPLSLISQLGAKTFSYCLGALVTTKLVFI